MNASRDNSLDCVGAICVLFMIIGHAFQWSHTQSDDIYKFLQKILFFFMAFFFYKSGMFYNKTHIRDVLHKGVRKFLIPFLIYMLIGEIVRWVRLFVQENDTDWVHYVIYPFISIIGRGGPSGNVPLWFLLALFSTQVIIALADNLKVKRKFLFLVSFMVAGIGSVLQKNPPPLPLIPIIFEIANGIIFFLIGSYMRNYHFKKNIFWLSFFVYIATIVLVPSSIDFRKGSVSNGFWLIWVVSSVAGIILFINIFRLPLFSTFKLGIIGRFSMQFFCLHWVLFDFVCLVMGIQILEDGHVFGDFFTKEENYSLFFALCVSSMIVLPLYAFIVQRLKNRRITIAKYL